MVPAYVFVIDISTPKNEISFEKFREQVEPCLNYLVVLKGAFDSKPCTITYYPQDAQSETLDTELWSVRCVVMISIGKQRAQNLICLYEAIYNLILFELPLFDIKAQTDKFEFS